MKIRNRNYWGGELRYYRMEVRRGITIPRAGVAAKMKRAAHKQDRRIARRLVDEQLD